MYLDVPFVTQLEYGHNKNQNDPTGCWYSSACMLAYSFEAGPRLGIPALHSRPVQNVDGTATTGHWAMELGWVDTFMKNEHLAKLDGGFPATPVVLRIALKKWGPLIVTWWKTNAKGQEYGHASVVIGVEDREFILHDPENAPNFHIKFADFMARHRKMSGDKQQWWPVFRRDALPFTFAGKTIG